MAWRTGSLPFALALAGCRPIPGGGAGTDTGAGTGTTGADPHGTSDATAGTAPGTAGPDTSDTSGSGEPVEPCGFEILRPGYLPQPIVFVVERSARMADHTFDHDDDPETPERTPWSVVHESIAGVIDVAEPAHCGEPHLGLVAAPSPGDGDRGDACLVTGTPDAPAVFLGGAAVLAALPPGDATAAELAGGTPLVAAFDAAVEHLAGARFTGRVVLYAHTPANCHPDADPAQRLEVLDPRLAPRIVAAREQHGIWTSVIGVDIRDEPAPPVVDGAPDGVNPRAYLQGLADAAGGQLTDASDWHEVALLFDCEGGVIYCDFYDVDALADPLPPPAEVSVVLDGAPVPHVACSPDELVEGWRLRWSEYYRAFTFSLCGATCMEFWAPSPYVPYPDNGGLLEVEHPCPG